MEEVEGLEYSGMFLVLPAAVVLTFWQGVLWAAWPALVVGLLGVVMTPLVLYRVESAGIRVPWWGYLGMGALTCKFLGESWLFVT